MVQYGVRLLHVGGVQRYLNELYLSVSNDRDVSVEEPGLAGPFATLNEFIGVILDLDCLLEFVDNRNLDKETGINPSRHSDVVQYVLEVLHFVVATEYGIGVFQVQECLDRPETRGLACRVALDNSKIITSKSITIALLCIRKRDTCRIFSVSSDLASETSPWARSCCKACRSRRISTANTFRDVSRETRISESHRANLVVGDRHQRDRLVDRRAESHVLPPHQVADHSAER